MKVTVSRPVEVEVYSVEINIPVRYDEEDIPNDFPLREKAPEGAKRKFDRWLGIVHIDSGKILNWPEEKTGPYRMHMKVCDEGTYSLLDANDVTIAKIAQDYVPNKLVPGEYGDYVILEIMDGVVTNWPKRPCVKAFFAGGDDE